TTGLIDSQRTPRRSRKWSASHPDERDIGFSSMRLSWSFGPLLAAVLCLFGGMVAAQASPAPAPQFPAGVELVSVDVVVLDKAGQPASDLAAGDFKVEEDGAHQTLASFEAVRFEESSPTVGALPGIVSSNQEERVRPDRSFTVVYDDVHLTALGAKLAR